MATNVQQETRSRSADRKGTLRDSVKKTKNTLNTLQLRSKTFI